MCGFVSIISNRGPVRRDLLERMRDQLIHRGPDAAGTWMVANVGFGQRRLSILDPRPVSDQPMVSEDGRYVLNYNGEIYNYIELREELMALGAQFRTKSDTEVLLQALITWGEDAVAKLNGMFAFTIWDNRTRKLMMARDRFGEKPLFYHSSDRNGFIAASEMKAILADAHIGCEINPASLEKYQLGSYYEDGEATLFEGISRLEPSHLAWVGEDGRLISKKRYWTPDYTAIDHCISRQVAVDHFRHLLRESVRLRLRSDVPVGSSLSGGMDSSAIVGHIAELRATNSSQVTQNVFSARFSEDKTLDEGPYIDRVVRYNFVQPHMVSPSPEGLMAEMQKLTWHQEEPFLSASIYLQYCVARLAKQNNVTVLLDGQGADELLGGYQFYYRNYQLDMLDRDETLRAVKETLLFNTRLGLTAMGYKNASRRFNAKAAFTCAEVVKMRNHETGVYGGGYELGVPPLEPGYRIRRQISEALQYNALPQLLRYADRNAMAFSREGRMPFLDHNLVNFAISLPDNILFHNGWQKYPLRKSTAGLVPNKVRWRADKVGYAAPLDLWLRGPMKSWAEDILFHSNLSEMPHFNEESMRELWSEHQNGANHSWAFWRWISLSQWMDMVRNGNFRRAAPN